MEEPPKIGVDNEVTVWEMSNLDPQREALETTFVLGVFASANVAIVQELSLYLDRYKARVVSLENQLIQQKRLTEESLQQLVNLLQD
jgi:hypothetical protein